MSASDSWKLLVFREGKTAHIGSKLLQELRGQIERVLSPRDFTSSITQEELIEALLRAGELECALADLPNNEFQNETLEKVTDAFAASLISQRRPRLSSSTLDRLCRFNVPEELTISPPEGFCYYALHPLDYADLLSELALNLPAAAVVGIRSIGTTLSAIVAAWFKAHGIPAERITVRPTGHPFDRRLVLDGMQRDWVAGQVKRGAQFFVVDEGPGLSGSSFLSVAEALEEIGVARESIVLLPSSVPDLDRLIAANAATRWSRYRAIPLRPTRRIPSDAAKDISGGAWRKHVYASDSEWPAVWPWTERKKYLSEDSKSVFRFDGHGHYGKSARRRSELLAEHAWGPDVSSAGDGFTESPWLSGICPRMADRETLIQLARYCAFRAKHFAHEPTSRAALEEMTRVNLDRALGISRSVSLPIERPVIADARMMPHEWLRGSDGRLLKVDASSHGDDHFYPGPTDIAWDVAGAITEWKLHDQSRSYFVAEYERQSGDRVDSRLPSYLIAYLTLRLASTVSAAFSVTELSELARLKREEEMYGQMLTCRISDPRLTRQPVKEMRASSATIHRQQG